VQSCQSLSDVAYDVAYGTRRESSERNVCASIAPPARSSNRFQLLWQVADASLGERTARLLAVVQGLWYL